MEEKPEYWKVKVDQSHPKFSKILSLVMYSHSDPVGYGENIEELWTRWQFIGKDPSFDDDGEYNAWTSDPTYDEIPLITIDQACEILGIK